MEQWCWPFLRQHGGSLELGSGRTDGAISEMLNNTNSKAADRRCICLIVPLTAGVECEPAGPVFWTRISAYSNLSYSGDYFLFELTNAC